MILANQSLYFLANLFKFVYVQGGVVMLQTELYLTLHFLGFVRLSDTDPYNVSVIPLKKINFEKFLGAYDKTLH
jgi:hypothetical protein